MRSAVVVLTGLLLSCAAADDAFTCCMGGWKVLHGVTQCPLSCCHGYEERVLPLPRLQYPVVCHKLTPQQLIHKIRLARLATATPALPPPPTTPQPRPPPASLRHLRDLSELVQELTEGSTEVAPSPARDRSQRDLVPLEAHPAGAETFQHEQQQQQQRYPRGAKALLHRHASDFKFILAAGVPKAALLRAFDDFLDELLAGIQQGELQHSSDVV